MWYNFNKIDSYNCPVEIVVSRRGLGKTFGKLKYVTEQFITKKKRFIYVVETDVMVRELTRNNGEKFWSAILKYYEEQDTSRKRYFYNKITDLKIEEGTEGTNEVKMSRYSTARVIGGTITINGETAGYILDMNSFGELKRNNFDGVQNIIIDEFISEKLDKTTLDNPRKISSIIQSVARLRKVKIFMFGNAVRIDDPILARLGFKLTKYGYYFKRDDKGLFAVLHFVDPSDYPEFAEAHDRSVAGRFAKMIGETNEEENEFITDLPEDRKLKELSFRKNGWSTNIVKDDIVVALRETKEGKIAVVPFSRYKTVQTLFCMTEKEQGYKMGYHVICNKALRQTLMDMLKADLFLYYSEIEYNQLKIIIKGV